MFIYSVYHDHVNDYYIDIPEYNNTPDIIHKRELYKPLYQLKTRYNCL